jgi:hypothetical protein
MDPRARVSAADPSMGEKERGLVRITYQEEFITIFFFSIQPSG